MERFFACLDRDALVGIAENSVKGLINQDAAGLQALCAEFSFPADAIDRLQRTMKEAWVWDLIARLSTKKGREKLRRFAGYVLLERV